MYNELNDIPSCVSYNLKLIQSHFEENMSVTQFAEDYFGGVSHQTLRTWQDENNKTIPPIDRIILMRNNLGLYAPYHPLKNFSLEAFYTERLVTQDEKGHFASISEEYRNLLGNYILYCYDPYTVTGSPEQTMKRALRYFVISVYARYGEDDELLIDGEPGVLAASFANEEDAAEFLAQLNETSPDNFDREESYSIISQYMVYDMKRTYFAGDLRPLRNNNFVLTLESTVSNTRSTGELVTFCFQAAEPLMPFWGSQGLLTAISHYPVAEEAILSRVKLNAGTEPIARFLDVDFAIPDLKNELLDAVVEFRAMADKLDALGLPSEDSNGILVQRIIKIYDTALRQVSFSHLRLDATGEEYGQIQAMILRAKDGEGGMDGAEEDEDDKKRKKN